jgi:hypothetical protein
MRFAHIKGNVFREAKTGLPPLFPDTVPKKSRTFGVRQLKGAGESPIVPIKIIALDFLCTVYRGSNSAQFHVLLIYSY